MFLVPEILWSPVLGILPFGKLFIENSDNHQFIMVITLLQFFGLLGLIAVLYKSTNKSLALRLLLVGLIFLLLWSFFVFYLYFATNWAGFP